MSRFFSFFCGVLFCGCLCLFGAATWAAEYSVIPGVSVRETYDDNVFLKETSDVEHRISPTLDLTARTEKGEITASGALDISEYERHSEFETVDQEYGLSARLMPSEFWEIGFSGTYVDDYTFRSALEDSGLLADRSRRKLASLDPSLTLFLGGRDALKISYAFSKMQYDLDAYSDYEVHGGNVTWYHDLMNERTRLIFLAGMSRSEFDRTGTDVTHTIYRGMVGLDHQFAENLKLTVMAGPRFTESEFPRGGVTVEDDDTGFVADGTLDWRVEERLTLSANINRDVAQSIYGENITRDRARLSFMYRLTERFRGNLSTAYYESETDGLVQQEKRKTYSVRPSIAYRITEKLDLRAGYHYTWTENQITDNSQERNRVYLQLAMDWPITLD